MHPQNIKTENEMGKKTVLITGANKGVMAIEFQQSGTPVEIFSVHPGPTTTDLNGNMSLPGFHDIDTVGLKFAQLISGGQNHQGEFIELYPIVKEDASYFL